MPYLFLNSSQRWSEGREPAAPKASDFEYLPAKELGGSSGPAKLRVPTGTESNSSEEFETRRKPANCIWP
jgi:hypothetical protein